MRHAFLAVLLVVVCAAAVLASSATAKKEPPSPPTPNGTFTLAPGDTITFSNMTLASDDLVRAGYCLSVFEQEMECEYFSGTDASYTNTAPFTITFRVVLADDYSGMTYYSDGTLKAYAEGSESQPGNHARLGWTADATQILVSINDGSQNPTTDWQPTLGEGNFNATVELTPAPPTGWAITKIEGYSDDPVLDETTNTYSCSFHTVITYTADKMKKEKKLTGQSGYVYLLSTDPLNLLGYTTGTLAASPADTSSWSWGSAKTALTAGEYAFIVWIEATNGDMLASQSTSTFTLDDAATYTETHGCPPAGLLVSTTFNG